MPRAQSLPRRPEGRLWKRLARAEKTPRFASRATAHIQYARQHSSKSCQPRIRAREKKQNFAPSALYFANPVYFERHLRLSSSNFAIDFPSNDGSAGLFSFSETTDIFQRFTKSKLSKNRLNQRFHKGLPRERGYETYVS